jgi:signal transduction histidine kinase
MIFSLFDIIGSIGILFLAWMISVIAGIFLLIGYVVSRADHESREQKLSTHIGFANQKLLERNTAQEDSLLTISHQLKTPLAAVTGYASMLLEEDYGRLNAAQTEAITSILESGKRAHKLVNGLMDAAAAEQPLSKDTHSEIVQIRELVASILQELKQSAEEKKLYLYFDQVHAAAPIIRGNQATIRQAILNVIDNAITYTPEGGVTVRMVSDAKGVRLSVHDTGAGIEAHEQPHVFEKFYRAESSKGHNEAGNGLGMFISRKIIEQHGGSIWIESEGHGKGTTFHVWLPIEKIYAQ